MYIPGDEPKRTARAPAKLNLYLDVGERRGDGFHELETLIVPIRIWDTLTLSASPPTADGRPGRIDLTVRAGGAAGRQPQVDPAPPGKTESRVQGTGAAPAAERFPIRRRR